MITIQFYSLSQTSLKIPNTIVEEYIPLWFADGTSLSTTFVGFNPSTSSQYILDGSSSLGNYGVANAKLHTLNLNWNASLKYAFESTIWSTSGTVTTYAVLVDITTVAIVANSLISTISTTAVVVRSGQFTLIPGHIYGVAFYTNGTATAYLSDASLIVFGS